MTMSAQLGRENVHDLEPQDVARGLAEGKVLLVDVREPVETQVERYPEAFYLPMSQFDPAPFLIRRADRWCSPAGRAIGRSPPPSSRRLPGSPMTRIWPAASRHGRRSACRPKRDAHFAERRCEGKHFFSPAGVRSPA